MSNWPQVAYLAILFMGMGVSLARYGEQKRDRYNAVDVWIRPALVLWILYAGGFFACFGWAP